MTIFALSLNERRLAMKPKKKMFFQEEYELDNYLNEDDDRYGRSPGMVSNWY